MKKLKSKNKYLYTQFILSGSMIARKYGFKLNPEFIYLIEAIKVEAYWSPKNYTLSIQNKNLPFLKRIEKIVKNLGINPSKRILLKIKPDKDFNREDITLISNSKLSFHIEKSPFDGSKKIVTSLPYKRKYVVKLKINSKTYSLALQEGKEEFEIKSKFKAWAYLDLRFPKIRLLNFLTEFIGNNKEVKVQPFLFNADKGHIASAFSALIDAEGSLTQYRHYRRIRIRMRNYNYLKQWKQLLEKFDIQSQLRWNDEKEAQLKIEGCEDFDKLQELGVRFYHSKKTKEFENILKSYIRRQVSRNMAHSFYIKNLKKIGKPITAREFSEKLGKSKRVTNHYLTGLMRKNLIKVDKSKVAYLYSSK